MKLEQRRLMWSLQWGLWGDAVCQHNLPSLSGQFSCIAGKKRLHNIVSCRITVPVKEVLGTSSFTFFFQGLLTLVYVLTTKYQKADHLQLIYIASCRSVSGRGIDPHLLCLLRFSKSKQIRVRAALKWQIWNKKWVQISTSLLFLLLFPAEICSYLPVSLYL